jgi:hypothetical protein
MNADVDMNEDNNYIEYRYEYSRLNIIIRMFLNFYLLYK